MNPSLATLFSALAGLYLLAIVLRFLLQLAQADFYNPVSQAIMRVTDPMVRIFRSFIPGYRNIDCATLIVACVFQGIAIYCLILIHGFSFPGIGFLVTWSVLGVVYLIINVYWWAIIATIVMSFVMAFLGNANPHPAVVLAWQLTEPVLAPFRKILPPMAMLDFSPMLAIILIHFIRIFLDSTFGARQVAQVVIGI